MNKYIILQGLIFTMGLFACSTTSTVDTTPVEAPKAPVIEVADDLTPCTTLVDIDPAIRSGTEDAFTLYKDDMRFKNFEGAKTLWKQAYYTAPGANGKNRYDLKYI